MSESSTASGGVGLGTVLMAIFITLKLTHVIDWSWWWVLSPLIVDGALLVAALVVLAIVSLVD